MAIAAHAMLISVHHESSDRKWTGKFLILKEIHFFEKKKKKKI